ncbi:hypothetical protein GCM10023235_35070 [Kitasatospora terrestris]|uniref:Uncharacterized protein n=1 Tax=Kitasatospora terrestris TaxID=258051 RepID=A0ABP9DPY5_9ACTN
MPDRTNAAGDVQTGYLVRNGERVILRHCSRLLAEFLRTIRQLEIGFAVRGGTPPPPIIAITPGMCGRRDRSAESTQHRPSHV